MKNFKTIRLMALSVGLASCAVVFSGCGAKKVNLNDYIEINYEGYDTAGVASYTIDFESMVDENEKAFDIKGSATEEELQEIESDFENVISGSFSKNEELSNGENISYKWDVSMKEKLKEKYNVEFVYEDMELTVDSLDKVEEFDPFKNVSVTFSGISPNGSADIKGDVDDEELYLHFTADKTSGLKNGDVVKVTVDCYDGDVENYCLQYGKIPTVLEKEFTVEGLSAYVSAIDEIPEDMQEKMKNQAMDEFTANAATWSEGNSLESAEFIGYYFLTPKEGFYSSSNNELYCVYKVTANLTGYTEENTEEEQTGQEVYYTYYRYSDIMLLEDGTCSVDLSNGYMTSNRIDSKFGSNGLFFSNYYFYGYSDLDSMFNECVTKKISDCNYESTVQ